MHSYFYPFCWCGYQCQNQFKYDYVLNRKNKTKNFDIQNVNGLYTESKSKLSLSIITAAVNHFSSA